MAALPREGLDLVQLHDVMNGIENFFKCFDLDFTHKEEIETEFTWNLGLIDQRASI